MAAAYRKLSLALHSKSTVLPPERTAAPPSDPSHVQYVAGGGLHLLHPPLLPLPPTTVLTTPLTFHSDLCFKGRGQEVVELFTLYLTVENFEQSLNFFPQTETGGAAESWRTDGWMDGGTPL